MRRRRKGQIYNSCAFPWSAAAHAAPKGYQSSELSVTIRRKFANIDLNLTAEANVYPLQAIAEKFSLAIKGDQRVEIDGLCGLSDNLPGCLSFITKSNQRQDAQASRIPAFVTRPEDVVAGKACLFHADPEYAIALIARQFEPTKLSWEGRIHPSAVIHATAIIAPDATIGPFVVVGRDAKIGAHSTLYPGVVVMDRVRIGAHCTLYPNAVVREDCVLGDDVMLQPGAVVGGDGYGYVARDGAHVKIPQLGNVVLEDEVEVGSNSTIDRGRFTATRIGRGTKIDNLVMVAHNVQTGEQCLIVAQTGISGSTRLGDRVTLAGQVGVTGHLTICDDVTVLGKSVVAKHVLRPGTYAGIPIRPAEQWRRAVAKLYSDSKPDE